MTSEGFPPSGPRRRVCSAEQTNALTEGGKAPFGGRSEGGLQSHRSPFGCVETGGFDPPHRAAPAAAIRRRGAVPQQQHRRLCPGTGPHPPSAAAAGCGVGLAAAPLFELWGEFAEFLQYYYSNRLCIFCSPTGVGLGYGGAGGIQRYFLSSARFLLRARAGLPEQLTAWRFNPSVATLGGKRTGAGCSAGIPIFYFPPQCRNVATSLPGR